MAELDQLPHGLAWHAVTLKVTDNGGLQVVVVYFCNIIEVLCNLISNVQFKAHMQYAPERHWTLCAQQKQVFGEMWTGDWWWEMQVSSSLLTRINLCSQQLQALLKDPNASIALLIIASDKTTLSVIGVVTHLFC